MECKDLAAFCKVDKIRVLIETLWNVKEQYGEILNLTALGINRNIVECKVFCVHKDCLGFFIHINRNIVECKAPYEYA